MKKFLAIILVIVMVMISVQQISVAEASSDSRLEQLITQGKVPQYVKTTGNFDYNSAFEEFPGIVAPTTNVNLRAEPNANSEKLGVISPQNPSQWPKYLGEWITPEGKRWVLGEFAIDDGKIHDANNPAKTIPVWIFGRYTNLMDEGVYSMILDGAAETGLEVSGNDSYNSALVELIRNKMYYNAYSPEAGYRSVGKQLEKFFSNGKWTTEKTDDKFYGNQRAVFRGLGVVNNGRRVIFSVIFIQRPNNGELVLLEVQMNGQTAYSLAAEQLGSLGFGGAMWMAGMSQNQFTLRDFIDYIYSRE